MHAAERYEHGLTLNKAGLYKTAIEQFEQAAVDPSRAYAKSVSVVSPPAEMRML